MVLTDDQKALLESARRFAREVLQPGYQQRDTSGVLDRELVA
ncbi:MAG: cyclohexanecarboxyl-CoA dehydrogenase, partial [Rubrivivax sp.]|nr:cyclohexanecarboxyl-CoA dehydrogenase [Rubrivivax sp.]